MSSTWKGRSLTAGLTPIVGRTDEIRRIAAWIDGGERLITLLGPPGIGKSRLLRESAEAFDFEAGSLHFADLSLTTTVAEMRGRFADELGFDSAVGGSKWNEALGLRFKELGRAVLLVDHAEGIAEGVEQLCSALLAAAPNLVIIVGSQRRLESTQEQVLELAPLRVPAESCGTLDGLLASDSGTLLIERLQRLNLGFDPSQEEIRSLVAIAIDLEGVPLSLELAAGRLAVMRPDELSKHLQLSTKVVISGRRRDHHFGSLRGSIEAALDAVPESERAVLAQATVFSGGFDATAARRIIRVPGAEDDDLVVLDLLESLWSRSLLFRENGADGQIRLSLLRPIAEVLAESADCSSLAGTVAERHLAYFADFGYRWSDAFRLDGAADAMRTLQRERGNLLSAFEFSETGEHLESERAMLALGLSTANRGRVSFQQLQRRLDDCHQALVGVTGSESLRARLLYDTGECHEKVRGGAVVYSLFERAGDLAAGSDEQRLECLCLLRRSQIAWNLGKTVKSAADLERAKPLLTNDDHYLNALAFGASAHLSAGQPALVDWQAISDRMKPFGEHGAWSAYINLALGHVRNMELTEALAMLTRVRAFALERGFLLMLGFVERYRANLLLELGEYDKAAALVETCESMGKTFELKHGADQLLWIRAYLAVRRGQFEKAADLLSRCVTNYSKAGDFGTVYQACCGDYASVLWLAEGSAAVERFLSSSPHLTSPALFALAGVVCLSDGRRGAAETLIAIAQAQPSGGEELAMVSILSEFVRRTIEGSEETVDQLVTSLARRDWDVVGLSFPRGALTTSLGLVIFNLARSRGEGFARRLWTELWADGSALLVVEDGTECRLPTGEWLDLSKRKQLARLLAGLARRAATGGQPLTADEVQELLWPGERMLAPSATNRIYKAISLLRGVGLGNLVRGGDGYRIDEDTHVQIVSLDGP